MTGFTSPENETVQEKWLGARMGGMVLAIHIGTVVPEELFFAEVDRMVRDVRETNRPLPGTDQALLPGAIEEDQFAFHRQKGIRYGETEQTSARTASQRLGVSLPWDE